MRDSRHRTRLSRLMQKAAQIGEQQHLSLQQYMPLGSRRSLTADEEQRLDRMQSRLIPKLWVSNATPIEELMHSPSKLTAGILASGGLLGGALGSAAGGIKNTLTGSGLGVAAAAIPAILAYHSTRRKNEDLEEALRRLPVGARYRDMRADPVYQKDIDRRMEIARMPNNSTNTLARLLGQVRAH